MTKFQKLTVILAACSLGAGIASAEECSGTNSRVSEAPVVLHTAEDGTVTSFLRSTGGSTVITPTEHAETRWSHCTGLMVTKADKSASGSGICFHVTVDGNNDTVSWQFEGNNRTWKVVSSNGSMNEASSGTWEWSVPMGNGLGIGAWKGDCEF